MAIKRNPADGPLWSAKQRGILMVLGGLMLAGLTVRYLLNRTYVPEALPIAGPLAGMLQSRVNPNLADEPTLAALPGIGPSMARRIVETRDELKAGDPSRPAFTRIEDMKKVPGIGQATMELLEPYLEFPKVE